MVGRLDGARVLVLGGSGFIGQHLLRALVDAGAHVSCFDQTVPPYNAVLSARRDEVRWVTGDFAAGYSFGPMLQDVDVVFHLISTTIPESSNRNPRYDVASNVVPTLGLLEELRSTSVKNIVFVSSGGTVYGIPSSRTVAELHPTDPICAYGVHKLAIEKYLFFYHYHFGVSHRILRLSNPYGAAQISDRPQGIVGKAVYKAIKGETLEVWGDGSVTRDYLYVEDAVEALLLAALYAGPTRLFNIGAGVGHSVLEIISTIERITGRSMDVTYSDARDFDVPVNILDVERARRDLRWCAKTDLETGIREMLRYGQQAGANSAATDRLVSELVLSGGGSRSLGHPRDRSRADGS